MIDNTMLKALNTIARKQSAPTELTEQWTDQILDYCATHSTATVTFKASDMQLKVYSDASYLNKPKARSSFAGYFFLGWNQPDNKPMKLNECLEATVGILKLVAAFAAKSELGDLFINTLATQHHSQVGDITLALGPENNVIHINDTDNFLANKQA